jgi:hypothetical protein
MREETLVKWAKSKDMPRVTLEWRFEGSEYPVFRTMHSLIPDDAHEVIFEHNLDWAHAFHEPAKNLDTNAEPSTITQYAPQRQPKSRQVCHANYTGRRNRQPGRLTLAPEPVPNKSKQGVSQWLLRRRAEYVYKMTGDTSELLAAQRRAQHDIAARLQQGPR